MLKKTIAVDFDGVIHAYSRGWHDGTLYDEPVAGALEALKELVDKGYRVALVTARLHPKWPHAKEQREHMIAWLNKYGFVEGEHYHEVTNNKPAALAYIDDRAVVFKKWEQALTDLKKYL